MRPQAVVGPLPHQTHEIIGLNVKTLNGWILLISGATKMFAIMS